MNSSFAETVFKKRVPTLLLTLLVVAAIRGVIYFWLNANGYFYGIPWDSFSRTSFACMWANRPFFAPADGYWLPFQFWLTGGVFVLLRPWIPTCEILVPVFLNHIFFAGSILIIYKFTFQITQKSIPAILACLLASIFSGDVFVTYSALSEPILIFLILLANYQFYLLVLKGQYKQKWTLLGASLTVCIAAATHYIGWFLALFFALYLAVNFLYWFGKKDLSMMLITGIAILFCIGMPIAWLLNNYLTFGNALQPIKAAGLAQADYIGQMTPLARFLVTPKVLIKEFYPITLLGLIALPVILLKKTRTLVFILPSIFVLGMIWISTWMALSAPYQEPRYLVFVGWMLIPFIAIAIDFLWFKRKFWLQTLTGIVLIGSVFYNLQFLASFRNSFGEDVRTVAYSARTWFETHPGSTQIIINPDTFAEVGVIPVISGFPGRFNFMPASKNETVLTDPSSFFNAPKNEWLLITKQPSFLPRAQEMGLRTVQIGEYYLIFSQPLNP
jgi:hypothetical protein